MSFCSKSTLRWSVLLLWACLCLPSALSAQPDAQPDAQPGTSASEPDDWIELFNGRDLSGWKRIGGDAEFRVANGEIVGISHPSPANSFLVTEKSYDDFVLELEFLVSERNNSGVQVRSASRSTARGDVVYGYQVEIDPSERAWTGGIYDESRRGWLYPLTLNPPARSAFRAGEWNRFRIECQGDEIRTWLNGVPASGLVDDETASGFVALQVHAPIPGVFDRNGAVRFRDIRIRPGRSQSAATSSARNALPMVINTKPNDLSSPERASGWRLLFDGQTTNGWRGVHQELNAQHGWTAGDGVLVTPRHGEGYAGGRDLVTVEEYGAFELQLEFRFDKAGNSGVKYPVTESYHPQSRHAVGLEYQILDDQAHPDAAGPRGELRKLAALYDLIAADKQARFVRGPGEWNHARIVFRGDGTVEHWLNHHLVLSFDRGSEVFRRRVAESKYRDYQGFGAWQRGRILLQDHGDPVAFRSIKLKELP